jgi:hypothetical protein
MSPSPGSGSPRRVPDLAKGSNTLLNTANYLPADTE